MINRLLVMGDRTYPRTPPLLAGAAWTTSVAPCRLGLAFARFLPHAALQAADEHCCRVFRDTKLLAEEWPDAEAVDVFRIRYANQCPVTMEEHE